MKTIEKRYRKVAGNFLQIRFVRHLDNFVECPVFAPITRTHTNSGGGHVLVIIILGAFNKLMASRLMKRRRKTHRHVKTNMCWALITCWQVSMFMYDCTNARLLVTRCPSHDDIEENAVDDDDNPSNQLICDSHHARLSLLVQHRNTSLSGQTTHTPTSYARCANTKPRVKIAMKKIGFFFAWRWTASSQLCVNKIAFMSHIKLEHCWPNAVCSECFVLMNYRCSFNGILAADAHWNIKHVELDSLLLSVDW